MRSSSSNMIPNPDPNVDTTEISAGPLTVFVANRSGDSWRAVRIGLFDYRLSITAFKE